MVQISRLKNQRWRDVIERGSVKSVLRHIASGATINAKDEDGITPLMWALVCDFPDIAKVLVERGAKVNAKDKDGWTALMFCKNTDMLKFLIEHGAKVNAANKYGRTPLIEWAENLEAVKLLLEAGADVNAKDSDDQTALRRARRVEIAQVLLDRGQTTSGRHCGKRRVTE